jgi:hypothetical protein
MSESKRNTASGEPANSGAQQAAVRNGRGQFLPGVSGNPAGRREGSRNRATLALQELLEGEGQKVIRRMVALALEGDPTALRLVAERLLPPMKDRPVSLELPAMDQPSDVAEAVRRALEAVASGEITPSEAETILKLLEAMRSALIDRKSDQHNEALDSMLGGF